MMSFRQRLTITLLVTFAVCAAMGQDPYAPQVPLVQAPQYVQPAGRYPLPPATAPQAGNQAYRYPLPQTDPETRNTTAGAANRPQTAAGAAPGAAAPGVEAEHPVVAASAESTSQPVLFKPGQIVARVGDKSILYADIAATVEMRLEGILAKAKTPQDRQTLETTYREPLTKVVIEQAIFNKLLLMEFERGIPAEMRNDVKKKAEMEGKLKKQIRRRFEEVLAACREKVDSASPEELEKLTKQDSAMVRLAVLMKERHLESYGELDKVLKQYGTSLEQQLKDYGEYMMGMEAATNAIHGGGDHPKGRGSKGPTKKEVTYDELLAYYQAHLADYYIPAKARFEILTAKFSRCGGDRQKTRELIAQMGNQVLLGGTPLPAVAKKYSHEPHAQDGGYYDWVTPGSLASKPIDKAVFSVEIDKLSEIIEDENGFHIIHVLERKEPGQISFPEAQPKIRETIENQRKAELQQKYLAEVRTKTKIWTIYDSPEETPQEAAAVPQ